MAFWITLIRSILAIVLGLAPIIQPEKSRHLLVNFMGMYWLASGIVNLRWGARGEHSRGLALFAAIVSVVVGLAFCRFVWQPRSWMKAW